MSENCGPKKTNSNAHLLEYRISRIISENAAIVETLDPLWSKRSSTQSTLGSSSQATTTHHGMPQTTTTPHSQALQQPPPVPPIGNILKQQLLSPSNQGSPLKRRKISEPIFPSSYSDYARVSRDVRLFDESSPSLLSLLLRPTVVPVRRFSVIQPPQALHSSSNTPKSITSTTTVSSSKTHSPIHSLLAQTGNRSTAQSGAPFCEPATIVTSLHTIVKPSASVPLVFPSKCIPSLTGHQYDSHPVKISNCQANQAHLVHFEVLPDYLPYLLPPSVRVTIKGPILFPVLKNSGKNDEFRIGGDDISSNTNQQKISTCFKQVASVCLDEGSVNSNSVCDSKDAQKCDEEVDQSAVTTVAQTTTIPNRPQTLPIRQPASSLISSTLVSPDTPRPKKTCVQLSMNGHAYTNIGLKVCVFKAQRCNCCLACLQNAQICLIWTKRTLDSSKFFL